LRYEARPPEIAAIAPIRSKVWLSISRKVGKKPDAKKDDIGHG
jgi:hypothetical protein